MTPGNLAGDITEHDSDDEGSGRSFHGRLLRSSLTKLPDRHRLGKLSRLVNRWGWIGHVIGQVAIFVAGLAIGGGIMRFRIGGESRVRPEIFIVLGVVCMLFAIAAQLMVREASRRWTSSVRG